MAEKFNSDSNLSTEELAKHLRQPSGETGKEVGIQMNKGNKHICLNSYKVLQPKPNNHILEIGMGNGFFVPNLLKMADKLSYMGVDFSPTMVEEAQQLNKEQIALGNVAFAQASIEELPFPANHFDCITTTNTLYFWPNPTTNIQELLRVLKPNGKLLIAYRSKSCMDQMELTNYGFQKYNPKSVEELLHNAGFTNITTEIHKEPQLEFDGNVLEMEGFYTSGVKA